MNILKKAKGAMNIHIRYHDDVHSITDTQITRYVNATVNCYKNLGEQLKGGDFMELFNYAKRYVYFLQTRLARTIGVGFINPESP